MNVETLAGVLQQQINQNQMVTLNDATLGTTGVDALLQQSPIGASQIAFATTTPPQVQGQDILLSGKTSVLGVAMPADVTITVGATQTNFILTGSPPGWTFSQSFPVLKGTPMDALALSAPKLIFTTASQGGDTTTVGLTPGLNVSAGLTLSGSYAVAATFFGLPQPTPFVLQGPATQTPQGPALELTGLLNTAVPVGPLSLGAGFVRAQLTYEDNGAGTKLPIASLLLGGTIPVKDRHAPLELASPTSADNNNLSLRLTGGGEGPIGGLGDLIDLLGDLAGWHTLVPEQLRTKLDALTLVDVGVGVFLAPTGKQVVSITVDLSLKTNWSPALTGSKALTLDEVTTSLTWEQPGAPDASYSIAIAAIGTVAGHAFELDITSDPILSGVIKNPASFKLADAGTTFFGINPTGPEELLAVEVQELAFTLDVPAGTFSIGATFSANVKLFGEGTLVLQDGGVTLAWSQEAGLSAGISGTLQLGQLALMVGAQLGAETTITGGLAPGHPLSLTGALNSLPGVSVTLPHQLPDFTLSALSVSLAYPSKAVSLSGTVDAQWAVPLGNVLPEVQVSLAVSSSLNGGQRTYAGTLNGVLDLGSQFSITYVFGKGATILRGEWLAQGAKELPLDAVASSLGIDSGGIVQPPGGMPNFALTEVGLAADFGSGVMVLTASSTLLQNASAFFIASKATGTWGFALGIVAPGPWTLGMLPGKLGQDLTGLDFLKFQKTALLVSTAAIALDKVTAAAGNLFDASKFPLLSMGQPQLSPGLAFVGEIDFGNPSGAGRATYLASIFQGSSLYFQGAFGGSLSTASFQANLTKGNSVTVTDHTNLSIGGGVRLVVRPSPVDVQLVGTLTFPVKGQNVLLQGGLTITESEATFTADAKFPELNSPVGFLGVSLLEIGANVGVTFKPPLLHAGLEAKLRIGQTTPTGADFAFDFDVEPDVSPRLLTAKVDRLDLQTMYQALVPNKTLPPLLASGVVITDFFIYWADQTTTLPDHTQATPGFGFNGQIDLFSVFQAQAFLKIAAAGADAGMAGDLEMSPVLLPASSGKILSLTGGSNSGGPKIAFQTKASPFLDVNFNAQLLGSTLQLATTADLTNQGLVFSLIWKTPIVDARFACTFKGVTDFSASASGTFGVDTDIPALVLDSETVIPGFHLKVQATLQISGKLNGSHFESKLHLAFAIGSTNLEINHPVTVDSLEDFVKDVEKQLADPKELFKDILQDAGTLLGTLKDWVDKGIVSSKHGLKGVVSTLKHRFSMEAKTAIKALLKAGFEISELAEAVKDVFNKSSKDIAGILKELGTDVEDVAKMLRAEFDKSSREAVGILKEVGFSAEEAGRALLKKFANKANEVVSILKDVGYEMEDVAKTMRKVFQVAADDAARLFKEVGYKVKAVAGALHAQFDVEKQKVVFLLKKVGYDARDAAEGLHKAFDASIDDVADWLKKADYEIKDAMKAVKSEFDADLKAVARAFKNAGVSKDNLKRYLKDAFDAAEDEVKKILDSIF